MARIAEKVIDEAAIMAVLETVPDPEIPVLTITDLGIVRGFANDPPRVLISPTYTGCPATVAIEMMIREALDKAGFEDVHVERVLFPPWTTDWISERGLQRLHAYGIAPPTRRQRLNARCAARVRRWKSAASDQRRARRSGAANPAWSPSSASSVTERLGRLTTRRSCHPWCAKSGCASDGAPCPLPAPQPRRSRRPTRAPRAPANSRRWASTPPC